MERKTVSLMFLLVALIFTIVGGTFAYLTWQLTEENRNSLVFTVTGDFKCSVDGGGDVNTEGVTFMPVDSSNCNNSEHILKRELTFNVVKNYTNDVKLYSWFNINNLGSYLRGNSNFKWVLSSQESCTEGIVKSGDFSELTEESEKIILFNDVYNETTISKYYLYMWLDKAETRIPDEDLSSRIFDLSLDGECGENKVSIDSTIIEITNYSTTPIPVIITNDNNYSVTANISFKDVSLVENLEIPANTTINHDVYLSESAYNQGIMEENNYLTIAVMDNGLQINYNQIVGYKIIDKTLPNVPDGLIPVTIANDGTVKTINKSIRKWYNYNNKLWANAVLVNQTNRSTYQGTSGQIIPESDILAYYVWIPRYKYKIWTAETGVEGQEQEIDIVFESKDEKSTGTQVGEYLTHPAFTFRNEELSGIWIGKFETTGTGDSPTIKPNVSALMNQNVSTQFQTSLKFAGGTLSNGMTTFSGSNTYGLGSEVNSHMAKNTEWGAAAYLSHSKYGINVEIRINNYSDSNDNTLTGCGASIDDAARSSVCNISYGSATSYPQSTTGNITGVFDMSGGAWEYVMGVLANSNGNLWSGKDTLYNSGFNGILYDNGNYTSNMDGIPFPESIYYEVYKASSDTTISALTSCNGGYCYGYGLSEVNNWYNDYACFVYFDAPWFGRGGSYNDGSLAGMFYFSRYYGCSVFSNGFRSILIFE